MTKRRVLLGTPVRDAATLPYLNGLLSVCQPHPKFEFIPSIARSTYVNCARNDLVEHARAQKCDDLVFIDADVGDWGLPHVERLLSHDVDIVGGVYSKRKSGDPEWTAHAKEGSQPDKNGLQPCNDVATGFLRVKMGVFRSLDLFLPQRRFKHDGEDPRTEYFPIGLTEKGGWQHPAEARLHAVLAHLRRLEANVEPSTIIAQIEAEMPLPELLGEDVSFCRLCMAAGFTVWADTKLHLRHHGDIGFPAKQLPL